MRQLARLTGSLALVGVVVAAVVQASSASPPGKPRPIEFPAADAIAAENARPGTTAWFVPSPAQDGVAGYAGETSYAPGDTVTLFVDSHQDPFTYTVYRMGRYRGAGARAVRPETDVAKNPAQPAPTIADDIPLEAKTLTTGWHASASFAVPDDWVTGFYLVQLTNAVSGASSYACFTLRAAAPAPVVVVFPTNTWQAYNAWGGLSLFRDKRLPPEEAGDQHLVPHVVSFLRPYEQGHGAGQFFQFSFPLVSYLELRGYPVSYATDEDVRRGRAFGPATRLAIVAGHAEYHTRAEVGAYLDLVRDGVDLGFLGGNDFVWQSRVDEEAHTLAVWRYRSLDPVDQGAGATIRWESVGWMQNALTGEAQAWGSAQSPERAYGTSHWAWHGAGVATGASIGSLQGSEYDGVVVNDSTPDNLTVLARSRLGPGGQGGPPTLYPAPAAQAMTVVDRPGGGFTFSAGQTNFGLYLGYPALVDPGWLGATYPASSQESAPVRRLVGNLVERATGFPNPEPVDTTAPPAPPRLKILSPVRNQPVYGAPGRAAAMWSDAPAGTAKIAIAYDGHVRATVGPRRNAWIGAPQRLSGLHTLTVRAVSASGRVLASSSVRVDFTSPSSPVFRQNVNRLKRYWN